MVCRNYEYVLSGEIKMNFLEYLNHLQCVSCNCRCVTYDNGKTFMVNGNNGLNYISLNEGEYAPCGKILKFKRNKQ